jgi:biotin carboxylase
VTAGSSPDRADTQPLVAVGYGLRCVPVMMLAEAAAGVCDLLWLIDGRIPAMAQMEELLERVGTTLDIGGLDAEGMAALVAPYGPDGVATFLDDGMAELAGLALRLGVPFHSPATAEALTDKARQRAVLKAAGLPGPVSHVVPSGSGAEALSKVHEQSSDGPLSWPAILKPRSAQGSRYTFLAESAADATRLLDALGPERKEMVLEDYLPGDPARAESPYADYVSVESLVSAGVISHIAVTGRFPMAENFRETGFFIPAVLPAAQERAVLDLATAAIEALGVTVGCLHTEIKFTPDGPRLIEVNGRVGGGVPEMLERAAGIPLLEWNLRVALGEDLRVDGPIACERIGYRFFLQPPAVSATVRTIDGVDAVSDYPGVDTISVHQGPGAELDWRDGTRTYIMAVVGSASDYEELLGVDRLLHRDVAVTYSEAHH